MIELIIAVQNTLKMMQSNKFQIETGAKANLIVVKRCSLEMQEKVETPEELKVGK